MTGPDVSSRLLTAADIPPLFERVTRPACVTAGGRVVYANPAMGELMGISDPAHLVGEPVAMVRAAAPEESEAPPPGRSRADKDGQRFTGATGRTLWVAVTTRPVRWKGTEARLALYHDVTPWSRDREALRACRERWGALARHLPDPYVIHRDGLIVYANPAAARAAGLEREVELIGRSLLEFVEGTDAARMQNRINRLLAGETIPPAIYEIRAADGTTRRIEARGVVITDQGQRLIQTICRDLTARKSADGSS